MRAGPPQRGPVAPIPSAPPGMGQASPLRSSATTRPGSSYASSTRRTPPGRSTGSQWSSAPIKFWPVYLPRGGRGLPSGSGLTAPSDPPAAHLASRGRTYPRSLREGDRGGDRVERRDLRVPGRRPGRGPLARRPRQRPYMPKSVVVDAAFDWGRRSAAAHALARDGDLRGPRQGLHRAPPGHPEELRGTYAGLAAAAIEYLAGSASPPSSCCPCTSSSRTPPRRARAAQLLGLQLDRLLRAARRATRAGKSAASRSASSSRWSRRCTRPGSR